MPRINGDRPGLSPEEQFENPSTLVRRVARSTRVRREDTTTVNPSLVDTLTYEMFTRARTPAPEYNEDMPGTTIRSAVEGCSCPACSAIRGEAEVTETPVVGTIGDDLPEAYAPARGNQLRNVSNGEYTFETGDRDESDQTRVLHVQVWTVSSGNLQGQRIIRRMQDGRWQGFATLQEDGTVWVWRSAQELRGTRDHRVLNTQFRTMHHQGTRLRRGAGITLNRLSVRIVTQRCNACNTPTNTPAAYCPSCLSVQDSSIQLDEAQYGPVARAVPRTATRTVTRDVFTAQRATVRPQQVRQPLMSEIDPTRIR